MTKFEKTSSFSRRSMLLGGGALVVSVGAAVSLDTVLSIDNGLCARAPSRRSRPTSSRPTSPSMPTARVSAFFGKMDMGHGLYVAIGQIVAEELDVPFKAVTVIMGDTATSVNQGGASGSTGIQVGGKQMRMAAAEARRVLVEMAAAKLGVPADQLTVTDGVVSAGDSRGKKVTYAELIGGHYFNVQLDWNKQIRQRALRARQGAAEEADRLQDRRPADQARGRGAEGVRAGGLRHRRQGAGHGAWPHDPPAGRRRGAGQGRRKLDQGHPGREGRLGQKGFLGVVADKEWDAIQAAQKLKVEWSNVDAAVPGPGRALRPHPQGAGAQARKVDKQNGNVDEAFKTAAQVIEAEYEWPFQSHASMGPACALVEIKDGKVTCWTGTQKSHFVQRGLAAHARRAGREGACDLGDAGPAPTAATMPTMPRWTPPCWRRRSASRCACNTCATRAPAGTRRARPRSTARARRSTPQGNVIAYEFASKGFSRVDVNTNGSKPCDTLAGPDPRRAR